MWDARCASSATSACSSARTRRSARRSTTGASRRRAGHVQVSAPQWKTLRISATRSRSRRRTAPAALCASRSARRRTRPIPRHKAIDMVPQPPLRERSAQLGFLLDAAGARSHEAAQAAVKRIAAPAAAVRVLRCVRRLRRDAVPQAADAALRRPRGHRERHRLFVDLRRQSADNSVHRRRQGRGPAWANSLFEDNAEFGLGMRLAVDAAAPTCRALVTTCARDRGRACRAILARDQSS